MRGLRCHCQCQGWGATPRHEPLALPRLSVTGADTEVTSPLPLRGTADLQRAGVESHECRTTMLLLYTSEHQQWYHKRWEQTTNDYKEQLTSYKSRPPQSGCGSHGCRTAMPLLYTSEHQQWYHKRRLLSNIHKTNNEPPTICIKEYFQINKRNGRKVQNVCKRIVNFFYNY